MNCCKLAMITLMWITVSACQSGIEPAGTAATVPIRLAYQDYRCRIDEAGIKRLANAAALADWWRPLATQEFPAKPLPQTLAAINFDASAVFVVFMGPQPTAGYAVELHNHQAPVQHESLTILAFWKKPAPGMMVPQVTTNPCAVITVPRGRYATVTVRDQQGVLLLEADF